MMELNLILIYLIYILIVFHDLDGIHHIGQIHQYDSFTLMKINLLINYMTLFSVKLRNIFKLMECIVLLQAICSDEIITDEIHQINQMIHLDEITHLDSFLNLIISMHFVSLIKL